MALGEDVIVGKVIQGVTVDNFFQQFGTDRLERYWSVVGCSMGVTGLKDGNNTGDLPCIRNSAGDERQIEKSAEDGTNRSSSVFSIRLVIPSIPAAELLASLWTRERTSEIEQEKQERVELKLY